ncbi:MAG: hypothetical protein Q8S84_06780 [bacterium]|nr:hypothetical protein [bacterium]MDP3381164.1 hypothetical protein [bacterium]
MGTPFGKGRKNSSINSYICSTDHIVFIKSTAFLGPNQSIPGILSAVSHTIDK